MAFDTHSWVSIASGTMWVRLRLDIPFWIAIVDPRVAASSIKLSEFLVVAMAGVLVVGMVLNSHGAGKAEEKGEGQR